MRFIEKTELGSLALDRQNNAGRPETAAEAKTRWADFGRKRVVRNRLLEQQQGLCAYTEFNIEAFKSSISSGSHGCHIEHIKPKSSFPENTFDYENLVICLLDDQDLKRLKEGVFCGEPPEDDQSHRTLFGAHAKGKKYEDLFISPLEQDCHKCFRYFEENGEITPSPDLSDEVRVRAEWTINLLNLNHPYLKNQRRKRMAEVVQDIEHEVLEKQQEVILEELSFDERGQLASFPSVVRFLVCK